MKCFLHDIRILSLAACLVCMTATAQTTRKNNNPTIPTEKLMEEYRFEEAIAQLEHTITLKTRRKEDTAAETALLEKARKGANMLPATQNVMIIDSMVVPFEQFISWIKLNKESGSISRYNDFFKKKNQPDAIVYVNGLGNNCVYAETGAKGRSTLFRRNKTADGWGEPENMRRISAGLDAPNFPFVASDGSTIYFGAKGQESLGGYDIFRNRMGNTSDLSIKPENIGMPFNSDANDYMYVEDDTDSIGWFVSDRYQKQGNVCIYIFATSDVRKAYDPDTYSEEQIRQRARVTQIADTWTDYPKKKRLMEKLSKINRNTAGKNADMKAESFVINEKLTYSNIRDFKSAEAKNKYSQYQMITAELKDLETTLEKLRTDFHNGTNKRNIKEEIASSEEKVCALYEKQKSLERSIRQTENQALKKLIKK